MFTILDPICTPTKGSQFSAAIDLYARTDITIPAGETAKIPLGISLNLSDPQITLLQPDHYIQLEPRSSIRAKGLQAGTGIIDLDYPGEFMLLLSSPNLDYHINAGDKVAQILLCEHKSYYFNVQSDAERTGGFGSTGV